MTIRTLLNYLGGYKYDALSMFFLLINCNWCGLYDDMMVERRIEAQWAWCAVDGSL